MLLLGWGPKFHQHCDRINNQHVETRWQISASGSSVITGSDSSILPMRWQAIILTSDDLSLMCTFGTMRVVQFPTYQVVVDYLELHVNWLMARSLFAKGTRKGKQHIQQQEALWEHGTSAKFEECETVQSSMKKFSYFFVCHIQQILYVLLTSIHPPQCCEQIRIQKVKTAVSKE